MENKPAKIKIENYEITYSCDECTGLVEYDNSDNWLMSNGLGTHFPHKCTMCNKKYSFINKSYPYTTQKVIR